MLFYLIIGIILFMYLIKLFVSILNYKNRHQPPPDLIKDVYDQESYQKWLSYTMENFRFDLIVTTINTLILVLFLSLGIFGVLETIAHQFASNTIMASYVFVWIYAGIRYIIGIPFSYYRKFFIEARYGFNTSTKKTFVLDQIKSVLLITALIALLISLLMWIYITTGAWFLVIGWIAMIALTLILMVLQTKVFLRLFNKITPLEAGSLKTKIEDFVKKSGYRIKSISTMDASKRSTKLNAFFSGFGKFKSIVLFDTLIKKLDEDEIVAVLAHEVAHGKHKDVMRMLMQQILLYGIFIYVIFLTVSSEALAMAFGLSGAHFGFGLIIFFVLLEPLDFILSILTNYLSRVAEYKADGFAAKNGYKKEMRHALIKLSRENFSNLTPHPIYVWLYYSHPTLYQRVKHIDGT